MLPIGLVMMTQCADGGDGADDDDEDSDWG